MNIKEMSQTNYLQLQTVLGSPLYDYYGSPPPAPRHFETLPAYIDWSPLTEPFLNPPGADFQLPYKLPLADSVDNGLPLDQWNLDQLYGQDMDYDIAPRKIKTKNGGRFLGTFLKPIFGFIQNLLGGLGGGNQN